MANVKKVLETKVNGLKVKLFVFVKGVCPQRCQLKKIG